MSFFCNIKPTTFQHSYVPICLLTELDRRCNFSFSQLVLSRDNSKFKFRIFKIICHILSEMEIHSIRSQFMYPRTSSPASRCAVGRSTTCVLYPILLVYILSETYTQSDKTRLCVLLSSIPTPIIVGKFQGINLARFRKHKVVVEYPSDRRPYVDVFCRQTSISHL